MAKTTQTTAENGGGTIHLTLQGKGGVGKSLIAAILAQFFKNSGRDVYVNMQLQGTKTPYTKGLPTQFVYSLVWNGQFGVRIASVLLLREPLSQHTLPILGSPGAKRSHRFTQLLSKARD
jgi:hypothetical protein